MVTRSAALAQEDALTRKDRLVALLEEIDAARGGPPPARGTADASLGELVAEWEILGEEVELHDMVLWANAFLFNRHLLWPALNVPWTHHV